MLSFSYFFSFSYSTFPLIFPSFLGTELFSKVVSLLGTIFHNIFTVFLYQSLFVLSYLYQMCVFSATKLFSCWLPPVFLLQTLMFSRGKYKSPTPLLATTGKNNSPLLCALPIYLKTSKTSARASQRCYRVSTN